VNQKIYGYWKMETSRSGRTGGALGEGEGMRKESKGLHTFEQVGGTSVRDLAEEKTLIFR